ncbi:MAG TPA: hypothetical protein VMW17_03240 [Candidatus Binatia bacterium]|nr:hypothetical protein [Candidatus Binatia bacterium]
MGIALHAANDFSLELTDAATWRLSWREPDWLGPIGFVLRYRDHEYRGDAEVAALNAAVVEPTHAPFDGADDLGEFHGARVEWRGLPIALHTSVRAYANLPLIVFRIDSSEELRGLGTGTFERPTVAWPAFFPTQRDGGGAPAGLRSYGHQYTEFALPVSGDADCTGFRFAPHRPPVVEPLLFIASDGRTVMLAPLDNFHEQIISVPPDRESAAQGVNCGWHGDLTNVPTGFATELAMWAGDGPRAVLDAWAGCLRRRFGTQRPSRYADDGIGKLSYWTDNGAVYYYRTERGCDYFATLERVVDDLRAREIPVRALQVDSWFYPHQNLRAVSDEGAPIVPPSGMMTWEPRDDLFPNGFRVLRTRTGNLPLTFHSRHFSTHSPYWERYESWRDGDYAHPAGPALFDRLMAQAASWGAITYEQDWMVESFLGVRGLREQPRRARGWQESLDRAAAEHGLTLQWCMATPADFFQTVTLQRLTSIRTSGDYRYLFDNGLNWVWFLHTNALARALGLNPFKDVFLSHGATEISSGEPYAEVESLLASLSTGPVAIGDQIGHGNPALIMRACREDGVLIKPDVPLAALDRCFRANAFLEAAPLIGEAHSNHPAGRWLYIASFNACQSKQPLNVRVALADLGALAPSTPVLLYNWRDRTWTRLEPNAGWECSLAFQDWDYRVACPLLRGDVTVFGDIEKYATAGDRRIARIRTTNNGIEFDVLGAPDMSVEICGYSARRPSTVTAWAPGQQRSIVEGATGECWKWTDANGFWRVAVDVGALGSVIVGLALD